MANEVVNQVILACPECGEVNGQCQHEDSAIPMTKGRAADLAVIDAFLHLTGVGDAS